MKEILNRLFLHEELTQEETCGLMRRISRGEFADEQVAALLAAFRMRDITVDELLGFRQALMETCVPIDFAPYRPIDIVGTGGDGRNTFNISTCACFVVAGAGYKVAKHGNYAATSVSGASNVIEEHGVRFSNDPDQLRRSLDECNVAYLHAQLFNPGMKAVGSVRRKLGVRTLFNLLGPLVNPCRPAYQLLGVADLAQMRLYTNLFYRLPCEFAVVNSLDSYDEISLTDEFKVMTRGYEHIYRPQELGFAPARPEELFGGTSREEAARIFDNVLRGTATLAQTQCVVVNAAFATHLMDPEKDIQTCIALAMESLESGRARQMFRRFVEINSRRNSMKQPVAQSVNWTTPYIYQPND